LARKTEKIRRAKGPATPRRSAAATGRRIVRTLAQSTAACGGASLSTHLGVAEMDSRFRVFDRTLVDRLQAPITRYHE